GRVVSGARRAAFAAAGTAVRAAAPPGDATLVVLPARSGIGAAGGRGAGAGFAACAPAAAGAGGTVGTHVGARLRPSRRHTRYYWLLLISHAASLPHHLQCFHRRLSHLHAPIVLAQFVD